MQGIPHIMGVHSIDEYIGAFFFNAHPHGVGLLIGSPGVTPRGPYLFSPIEIYDNDIPLQSWAIS